MNKSEAPFEYKDPVWVDGRLLDSRAEAIRQALDRARPDGYIDISGDERFGELATDIIEALDDEWELVPRSDDNT